MSTKKQIGIGVISLGWMGRLHARSYRSVSERFPELGAEVRLVAAADPVEEAQRAVDAGATAGLIYPSHGWLRFGFQPGAPQDRYRAIYEETGLNEILFQYPDVTKCSYDLDTQLAIAAAAARAREAEKAFVTEHDEQH